VSRAIDHRSHYVSARQQSSLAHSRSSCSSRLHMSGNIGSKRVIATVPQAQTIPALTASNALFGTRKDPLRADRDACYCVFSTARDSSQVLAFACEGESTSWSTTCIKSESLASIGDLNSVASTSGIRSFLHATSHDPVYSSCLKFTEHLGRWMGSE
jgi:hypothetical protein